MTYEQFIQMIKPEMLDANGKFKGPNAGVNYAMEGYTPQDYYDILTKGMPTGGGWDGTPGDRSTPVNDLGDAAFDPSWKQGPAPGNFTNGAMLGMLGMAAGANYLPGLLGGETAALPASQVAAMDATPVLGSSFGSGLGGDLMASTPGFESALSGGALGSAEIGSSLFPEAASSSWLDSLGSTLKGNPLLTQLGGAALGALSDKDTTNTTTGTKDPWGPAQQYLKDNLAQNASMQKYYAQNPFSTEQKGAYQGLFDTLANNQANGNVLLGNASKFGQSSKGVLPQMQGLLTGTKAPAIDWTKYQNIGLLGG